MRRTLVSRRFLSQDKAWVPPQSLSELHAYAPNLVSSIARNVLLELQQGKLHYSGQLEELISDLYQDLLDGERLRAFDASRYPKTPENGWKAFMVTVLGNLTKNWVAAKHQKLHFCPRISEDPLQPNTVSERDLPPDLAENPYHILERREISHRAESKMQRFMVFIEDRCGCSITSKAIELMSYDGMSLSDVQKALGLSDQERGILKTKTQELWYVFTSEELVSNRG